MTRRWTMAGLVAVLFSGAVQGQGYYQGVRDVGGLRGVGENLPSQSINETLGSNIAFTRGGQFFGAPSPLGASLLAARGIEIDLQRSGWEPVTILRQGPAPSPAGLFRLRVRTIDSLQFDRRARFAKLRETMLALAERIRQVDEKSLGQISTGFRELMFPIPLEDRPGVGYGFFSRVDLVGGGAVEAEALLAPFTADVQKGLGDERFLDAAQALLLGRPLPEGVTFEQFYDPQLAALANYLFNNARYDRAAAVWQELVRRDETSALRRRGLALGLLASRQMKRAAEEARRSLALAPGWPDGLRLTGSNLQDVFPSVRDLCDVRDELAALLAKQPGDADLDFLMAYVDVFHGNWPAGEARLARLAPADETARGLLGRLKAGAADATLRRPTASVLRAIAADLTGLEEPRLSPEARSKLIGVLQHGAASYEDHMRLGDFRFFMGDYTLAGEAYRAAHKAHPQEAFPLFALAHASFANGEYRLAARYVREAFAFQPGWGLYEFRLEEFYGDPEDFRKQVRNLERQIELRDDVPDLRFLLAYVYYFSGRYADAADQLADVLRLRPDFERADQLLRLARIQG